jgi:recombinational DNA repair protein (RecF pathway)
MIMNTNKRCKNCNVSLKDQHTVCWNCGTPVPQEAKKLTTVDFLNFLYERFNLEDLRNVTFDLRTYGVQWDNLPGETRSAKAQSLMSYFERHGQLAALWNHCANLRPGTFPLYDGATVEPKPVHIPVETSVQTDTADSLLARANALLAEAMILIAQARAMGR